MECGIFSKYNVDRTKILRDRLVYDWIKVLRCLILKSQDPMKWKKLIQLKSSIQRIDITPAEIQNLVNFIQKNCKQTQYTTDEIKLVFGIALTNSTEVTSAGALVIPGVTV